MKPVKLKEKIILIIFGLSCCSVVSTNISYKVGLPFGFPELIAIFFAPFLLKDYRKIINIIKGNLFKIVLVYLILLSLSFIFSSNNISAVISTSRSILLLIMFLFVGLRIDKISVNKLFFISAGSVLGTLLSSFLATTDEYYTFNNTIAFLIFILFYLVKRKFLPFVICVILAILIAVFSGLRRQLVEIGIAIFFGFLFLFIRDKGRILNRLLILVPTFLILVLMFYSKFKLYVEKENYFLYSRIFVKTENTLTYGLESEGSRGRHIPNLLNYFDVNIFPKGFYPRNVAFKVGESGGATFDFPLYEVLHTLGLALTFFLLSFILIKIFKSTFKLWLKPKERYFDIIHLTIIITLLFCLFFDGGFLQHNFITPFTGFMFGLLFRKINYSLYE